MINDCIRMFAVALCACNTKKINVVPDSDVRTAGEFISFLTGKCDVNDENGYANIKPLKRKPADNFPFVVKNADRELFMLISGIVAQLAVSARFEDTEGKITDDDLKHISDITQKQLQIARMGNIIYMASLLVEENPCFEECRIPEFAAGLCLGGALSYNCTLVEKQVAENEELVKFTLSLMREEGTELELKGEDTVILTARDMRFGKKEKISRGKTKEPI